MATVTITLTDAPTEGNPENIKATVRFEPGIGIGADAEPLTPAQSLAVRMMESSGGKLTGAAGATAPASPDV